MEELIHYTNSTPFHGHIHLMSLKFDALKAKMKLIIHVRYDDYDHLWEIKAENVIDYKNFTHCSLTPFFRIKEYSYHFLIKHNTEEQITLKLDKIPDEDPILLGKIHNFLKKETGLWSSTVLVFNRRLMGAAEKARSGWFPYRPRTRIHQP